MIALAQNYARSVDEAFLFILIVSMFFLVLITTLIITFAIKYSRKKNLKPKNIHGNIPLEILWTAVPTILVLIMFWYGWSGYKVFNSPPQNAMNIDVTAQMWVWKFKYPNGVQSDSLYVPVNRPVKVHLTSLDVNHSFYVPEFRVKKDVIPGRKNFTWFVPDKIGKYNIECAEYCGLNHSYMLNKVIVLSDEDYNSWISAKLQQQGQNNSTGNNASDSTKMEPLINK